MKNDISRKRILGNALITAIAPIIWGSTYLVTTEYLPADRPFIAAFMRVFPAGMLLLIYTREWPKRSMWVKLITLSVLNIGAFQAFLFISAYRLPGGIAAVLISMQPLVIMLVAWLVDRKVPKWITLLACITSVIGVAMLLIKPGVQWDMIGILAALTGAVSIACGTFFTRRWKLGLSLFGFTGWQLVIGSLFLAPFGYFLDPALTQITLTNALGYAYLSLAGALLAYFLWFRGVSRLPAVAATSLGALSPLTAVIIGWVVLGQRIEGTALVGLCVVFGSILVVQLKAD